MKLISFCVFGSDPTYSVGALRNMGLYRRLLPDYTCHFYLGRSVDPILRAQIAAAGGTYEDMALTEDWSAPMWRFEALRRPEVTHFLFRDTDSRPMQREVDAVRAWEASGKAFHVMRDHPAHGAVMLAGMWGCTQGGAASIRGALEPAHKLRRSADYHEHLDQAWLELKVWPTAKLDALVHADYWTTFYGPTERFPTKRVEGFVGEAFDHLDNLRYPDHHDVEALCRKCQCSIRCPN